MTTEDADIEIVPVFSGHRTAPDRVLVLARYYGDAIENLLDAADRSLADLRVAIPVRQIVGARPFDLDVYRSFNPHGDLPSDRDNVQDWGGHQVEYVGMRNVATVREFVTHVA